MWRYNFRKNWLDRSLWCCCTNNCSQPVCRLSMDLIFVHSVSIRRAAFWLENCSGSDCLQCTAKLGRSNQVSVWSSLQAMFLWIDPSSSRTEQSESIYCEWFSWRLAYNAPQGWGTDKKTHQLFSGFLTGRDEAFNKTIGFDLNFLLWELKMLTDLSNTRTIGVCS